MFAKINRLAIVSEQYALSGKFYQSVFGVKTPLASPPPSIVMAR